MQISDRQVIDAATDLARGLAAFCEDMLGPRFIGFYLIGSLAHGGFNRRYSDIDVALVTEDGIDEAQRTAFDEEARRLSPELAGRVSLFWSNRGFSVGRFPPLDRLDYIDRAVPLAEREKVAAARPSLDDVRTYLGGAPFEQWATRALEFATKAAVHPDERKTYLKTHLYPARFAYSWLTGSIASNDDAVAYLRAHPPAGLDLALIGRALDCRRAAADPDPLFADRFALPAQYEACGRLMSGYT